MKSLRFISLCLCFLIAVPAFARQHRSWKAKHEFMVRSGHPHGWKGHVVDHVISLKCGGPDQASNMQWESVAEAKAKDRWELRECRLVDTSSSLRYGRWEGCCK